MIKTQAMIEIDKNEKNFRFYCDNEASLGEAYDAIRLMMEILISKMNELNKPKEEEKENGD